MDGLLVSPDGRNLYIGDETGLATLRHLRNGRLQQPRATLGCGIDKVGIEIGEGDDEGCLRLRLPIFNLDGLLGGVVSPDGRHVYFGSPYSLFAFRRL